MYKNNLTEDEEVRRRKVAEDVALFCDEAGCNRCPFSGMHQHAACVARLAMAMDRGEVSLKELASYEKRHC